MPKTLNSSLFTKDKLGFQQLKEETVSFNIKYNGSNIVQDDIFHVLENFTRKNGYTFELLRYPIKDPELCACTFLRKGRVFVLVNAALPLCKQIFAAAHELYHIHRFFDGENLELASRGSILTSNIIDDQAVAREDLEANAFAGLFLAPSNALHEQIWIYGIDTDNITVYQILTLMDIFAIPYKAMVLRLYEDGYLTKKHACALLNVPAEEIKEEIQITGKSKRWANPPTSCSCYGSLLENLSINIRNESLAESRQNSDEKRIQEIMARFGQG